MSVPPCAHCKSNLSQQIIQREIQYAARWDNAFVKHSVESDREMENELQFELHGSRCKIYHKLYYRQEGVEIKGHLKYIRYTTV